MQLLGPGRVAHDFDVAPFCTLQLVLRVRNTLPSPAAVCVETGKGPDGRPTPLGECSLWRVTESVLCAAYCMHVSINRVPVGRSGA